MINAECIAERVRMGRAELGMTQTDLAVAAGISRPTVARIEAGGADSVAIGTIQKVLNATNWDLSINRGVTPTAGRETFDVEKYLDSLFGDAR